MDLHSPIKIYNDCKKQHKNVYYKMPYSSFPSSSYYFNRHLTDICRFHSISIFSACLLFIPYVDLISSFLFLPPRVLFVIFRKILISVVSNILCVLFVFALVSMVCHIWHFCSFIYPRFYEIVWLIC